MSPLVISNIDILWMLRTQSSLGQTNFREICNESGRIKKKKRKKKKKRGEAPRQAEAWSPGEARGRSPGSGGARDFAALKTKKKRKEKRKEKKSGGAKPRAKAESGVRAKPETSRHFVRRSPDYHDGDLRVIYCLGANPRAHTQLDNDGDICSGRGRLF